MSLADELLADLEDGGDDVDEDEGYPAIPEVVPQPMDTGMFFADEYNAYLSKSFLVITDIDDLYAPNAVFGN